ncbi:hypothetical protein P691DRAFT_657162 [Macrolepiota fuliginosa MF-IS2]|uniref:RING-type domain-containing protein n=1 Tax=Macrolepiota fuliginosa MF-IS2 TaxID=1400762 RepID=A0A9P5XM37_9AGAR|nr:hypothetical protein P691DRAFT_657162 [Macrolepiota fuliginosa MF-IS2]
MPRAQSPPGVQRAHLRTSPLASKPSSKRHTLPSDVLELSSDTTHIPLPPPQKPPGRVASLTTRKHKSKPKAQIQPSEVIEISSDEDDAPPSQEVVLADLRRQVKKLKQENDRHIKDCSSLATELARCRTELKEVNAKASEPKPTDGKLVLDPSQVEDGLSCEICTSRMYTPYLLPDCGHTFCFSCLKDWFGTTHARFLQANPHWSAGMVNLYVARIQGLLRPEYLNHPQIHNHLLQLQQPQPEYTCPTCRKRVLRRPVEDYALKALVRNISAANEVEKRNIPPDGPLTERRHGHLIVVDPWEGYFPKDR